MDDLRLRNGDRVIVAGGGPAGSFAALHLLKLAHKAGIEIAVDIYEPRDLLSPGATRNCKGCAGILSAGAVRHIAALGLTIPAQVVQSELRVYEIHVGGQVTTLEQPASGRKILSVYRGAGPRHHLGPPIASFDGWLLAEAVAAGARHVRARIRSVTRESAASGERGGRPVVHTDRDARAADFLVLATGVNSRSPLDESFGYAAPPSAVMAQDEITRPDGWCDDTVAGFFGQPEGLLFGALVPKGEYLNVSLLWGKTAERSMQRFYDSQAATLRGLIPSPPVSRCGCNPRILTGPARAYYGDRWVAVGDAAVSHLYKDGIHSAFVTASTAMAAAVELGISGRAFSAAYRPLCTRLAIDNRFGSLLYSATGAALRPERCVRAFVTLVRAEAGLPVERRTHARLLWGMLTGDEPYHDLFRLALRPKGLLAFGRTVLRS